MNFVRTLAIARKEAIHIMRDWRSLLMALGAPVFLLVLFGNALTLDVEMVPMVVFDQAKTPDSSALVSRFFFSRYFKDAGSVASYDELEDKINRGEAVVGVVIPADFDRLEKTGRAVPIQAIFDGSDSNTATIALGYLEAVAAERSKEMLTQLQGGKLPPMPIEVKTRIWFNGNAESKNSIIPGLIAVIMMVNSALLTSMTISREWEKGTMEQLISTPVRVFELYMGKMFPYFVIGLFDVVLVVLIGEVGFHVPLRGDLFFLFIMATIFLIGSLSMGMLISIVGKTQLVSSQLAMVLTFLPSILLSGFLSALSNMPQVIQTLSLIVPARYFVTLLRDIYLKGTGWKTTWDEVAFLTLFALLMVILSNYKFKKKLS